MLIYEGVTYTLLRCTAKEYRPEKRFTKLSSDSEKKHHVKSLLL